MDCSLPSSFVHGILQARILEWIAVPSSRGIFPTQELNLHLLHLLHWQEVLYPQRYLESPIDIDIDIVIDICIYSEAETERERQRIIHTIMFCKALVNTKPLLSEEIQDTFPASFRSQHSPQPINTQSCFIPVSAEHLILMLIYWCWAHGHQHWISYLKEANLHKAHGSLPTWRNTRQYVSSTTIVNSRSTNFKQKIKKCVEVVLT